MRDLTKLLERLSNRHRDWVQSPALLTTRVVGLASDPSSQKAQEQQFKGILGYTASPRPAWGTQDPG